MLVRLDATRVARALRAALGLAVVLGLLAACHFALSSASDAGYEAGVSTSGQVDTEVSASSPSAGTAQSSTDQAGEQGLTPVCGLMIACVIALAGLGAMLVIRAPHIDRVLWMRPVPLRRFDGVVSRRVTLSVFIREPAALVC